MIHTPQPHDTSFSSPTTRLDDRDKSAEDSRGQSKRKDKKKHTGQNTHRSFGSSRDALQLCTSVAKYNELSPGVCRFGEKCSFEHDLRSYLKEGKRQDLETFDESCPVYEIRGTCPVGWKCRFVHTHSEERTLPDGRKELVLLRKTPSGTSDSSKPDGSIYDDNDDNSDIHNVVTMGTKIDLRKKKIRFDKAEKYADWLEKIRAASGGNNFKALDKSGAKLDNEQRDYVNTSSEDEAEDKKSKLAAYFEEPFLPSEKRRLYFGPETPVLAPLTTQGNLPFRRVAVDCGAQLTWCEMAMGQPLITGEKAEWTLLKAHSSELTPPAFRPRGPVVETYDNSKDMKFGVQIAANKSRLALQATEAVTTLCPQLRAIDLNCGCPIDLIYKHGAGSALLDGPSKLEQILRGMNAVSGEVPITVKIRMGTRDDHPMANKLINRLALGGGDMQKLGLGPCGVAAVTLHGRSRQQRYTRSANWGYISNCAALVERYNKERYQILDTIKEPDARDLANSERLYFCGNGDCYSYEDYYKHIDEAKVDTVMIARGALIKPWIFEEINARQHLDKSSTERLQYIEKFCRYGLDTWGSDEMGVGTTRRFLLEWLSFACRYVPIGLLEVMPPNMQERPPAYRGRNELETLMASDNYKDWIKISEMFLGKAADGFKFEPKHKSNAYEVSYFSNYHHWIHWHSANAFNLQETEG